jgi:lipoprotein NlpI
MKLLAVLLAVGLVGCASNRAMSYQQLESIQVTNRDCSQIDTIIQQMEQQLQAKGYAGKNPEDLATEEDRRYNSRARAVIWSLRIGCNNPNRYK